MQEERANNPTVGWTVEASPKIYRICISSGTHNNDDDNDGDNDDDDIDGIYSSADANACGFYVSIVYIFLVVHTTHID